VPNVIFTGATFPDGSWKEVLALAADPSIAVVLTVDEVGPYLDAEDMKSYLDAMERGVFDFVVAR
jgi:hypothetical protein